MGSITITFTPPGGTILDYGVSYRLVGDTTYTTLGGYSGSPIVITGLADGCYEGYIFTRCTIHSTSLDNPTWMAGVGGDCATFTCGEYYNDTGSPVTNVSYTACDGTPMSGQTLNQGDSICIQEGTGGGNFGFLIRLGDC